MTEARKIGRRDRAANGEGDLVRSGCRHRAVDGCGCPYSAVLDGHRALSALSNPHRLRMLATLASGSVHVSQLARDVC